MQDQLITRTALELYAPALVCPPSRAYAKDALHWAVGAKGALGCAESDGLITQHEAHTARVQIDLWLDLDARVQFPL